MRLIDADALIRTLGVSDEDIDFQEMLYEAPSIDIVRCKECVKANTKDCSHSYWDDDWGVWHIGYKGDDWFCADGEMNEICGDNRFEIIERAKKHLLDATNIDTSADEMKVLDSFLFRCWQMGWLDRYDTADTPQTDCGWK